MLKTGWYFLQIVLRLTSGNNGGGNGGNSGGNGADPLGKILDDYWLESGEYNGRKDYFK